MSFYANIESDMKSALKSGDTVKLSVLRMLISAVRKAQMDKGASSIEDKDVTQVLGRQIKQHRESISQFIAGNRQDLADKETAEMKILESYMPAEIAVGDLEVIVQTAIRDAEAKTKADMGKVMKLVMERTKGCCDGKQVSQIVSKSLQ